jgi:hypothetical protein
MAVVGLDSRNTLRKRLPWVSQRTSTFHGQMTAMGYHSADVTEHVTVGEKENMAQQSDQERLSVRLEAVTDESRREKE